MPNTVMAVHLRAHALTMDQLDACAYAGRDRAGIADARRSPSDHEARKGTAELLAAVGITVTEEGKARAQARLAEAEARWTPVRWAALRTQLGLPTLAA